MLPSHRLPSLLHSLHSCNRAPIRHTRLTAAAQTKSLGLLYGHSSSRSHTKRSTRTMATIKQMPAKLAESVAHSKTEYRQLGKSGLRVSVPILGAMSFGDKRWAKWVVEEDEALPLLKGAWDRGLNTWDTANIYSNGESERLIAKAIKKYNIPRHKLIILTKCWSMIGEEPDIGSFTYGDEMRQSRDYVNQGGLSRQAIFNAVDASLARLETSYIDLLQIHRFDKTVPIEETMKALHDLVQSGKVRYIGASSMWAVDFARMQFCAERHGWTKFVSMQNHYNLLYREEEREMNRFCDETGVGLIPWAPLCRGHLARKPDDFGSTIRSGGEKAGGEKPVHAQTGQGEVDRKIIGRVMELADKKGWKMSQVALAWIKTKVASPIVGFSNVDRIDESIQVWGKELTDEEVKYLEELYEPKSIMGHS